LTLTVTAITPVSAAGAHDATATLQATGGSGSDYRYSATGLDNDFSANNVLKGLFEGINYVYAKDQNGCMVSVPIEVGKYPDDGSTVTISLTATVTKQLTCEAVSDAEITVQAFGSSAYQYSKDGVTFTALNVLKGFGAGVHAITVKDGAGRLATIDVTVNPAAPLLFTATITKQLSSAVANDAEVTLNIIGYPTTFEYSKDEGQSWESTNVFSGLSAGTYAFTVRYKDPASCAATPIVVGIPTVASSVGITATITRALTCGSNTGAEIKVTALGGNGTYTYSLDGTWTNPASTVTEHVYGGLSAGTYGLQVSDGIDQSAIITLAVTPAVAPPVISLVASTATTCGNNNGSIAITAAGGMGTHTFEYSISGIQWSYSNRIANLSAGNYNVLVRDGRGCTSDAATVTVAAIAPVTFEVTSITRASALTASDGQIAVTITDGQAPYTLNLNGASTYSGYAPSTTYTFNALEAGHYTLTVIDANGCVAMKNVLVGAVGPDGVEKISVAYATVDPTCRDAANGQIIVTARGGSGTYTYSLDDRSYDNSSTFTGLLAGTYVVYVKDNATPVQKVYVSNVVLNGKEALSLTAAVVRNLSSAGNDAAVLITTKGGTAPYQYKYSKKGSGIWTDNGYNGYVGGLSAGTYDITVSDDKGCSISGTIQIAPFVPGESTPRPSISVSVVNEPACFGGNDGAIAVTASGGRSPYAYSVNQVNWTTNNTITGLMAGTYTVYVKELSLNRITEGPIVVLTNPDRLTASAVMTAAITAPGAADGAVRVDAAGGMTPYQYSIDAQNTYQYGNTFTGLQAQLYTFYVKDGKGCATTANIVLAEPGKVTVSAQITKFISCYGAADAEVTVTASGGTQPYDYRWDGTQAWSNSATLTGVAAGVHDIFVRDNVGNITSVSIFIPQPMMLAVTAQATTLPTGTDANGAIAIVASGGAGNYAYEVDATPRPVPAVSGLKAGNHTVKVTDGNGCTAETVIYLASVDVIVNKTVINLQKGHTSETYTIRLASAPEGNVTVGITALNGSLVTITPPSVTFTPGNWGEQEVGVTIAQGVGSPAGGITYFTTNVQNRVTGVSDQKDADYMNIVREVIVNVTDDGKLNCAKFESTIPDIKLNGSFVNSPFAICTPDNNQYVLTTTVNGDGYMYRWMKDNVWEVSTEASYVLDKDDTGTGTYTVIVMNANGCKVVSEPFAVRMEVAPEVPVIEGLRVAREGQNATYRVKTIENNVDYRWVIPSGYDLVGGFDSDPSIMMKIGSTSSILRVVATRNNSMACASVEGRLSIEVKASYGVDVFPTVTGNGEPLRIIPKNMIINSIAIVNVVGESYPYRITAGRLPLSSVTGEELQIMVNGLPSGHYFVVFYGQELNQDGSIGRSVTHTEHIVVKN
jgi:hypothetical protein